MPNTCQEKNARRLKKVGWDAAIADVKDRIRQLEFSLRVFKKRKRAGEPWSKEWEIENKK